MVTRLALFCVCDDVPKFLGTPYRRVLGTIPPSCDFCLETQEPFSPTTLWMRSFPGPRRLATVLVLLEFGGRYESFEHVHC